MSLLNINRSILSLAAVLAAIQIVTGIDDCGTIPIAYYTFSYGIFLISALLMLILGVDIIEHELAALTASTLPLGFSMGLVSAYMPEYHLAWSSLLLVLFAALVIQKRGHHDKSALILQIFLHGLSGLVLFILPLVLIARGEAEFTFLGVSIGTGLIAIGGMALALVKSGKPVLSKEQVYLVFPGVLLLAVIAFSVGISGYLM